MSQTSDQTAQKSRSTAKEDETLDIVRLLIETETRHAEVHSQGRAGEESEGAVPARGGVLPRRVTLRGKPRSVQGQTIPEERVVEDLSGEVELEPAVEDLRPRRLALPRPSFRLPRLLPRLRRTPQKPAEEKPRAPLKKEDIVKYAKLGGLVAVACLILFKPWVLPLVLFVLVWLSLVVFLLLGSARISELVERGWELYAARRPEKAARIMGNLQRAADRVDGILARLPERWVDGIFTPDLGRSALIREEAEIELPQDDPFARLATSHAPAE